MIGAYQDRKAHAIGLYNDLVDERLSQSTKAVKIDELKEEKEALTKELQKAKSLVDETKQWFSNRPGEGIVRVEDGKNDQDDAVSYVPRRSRHEYPQSTGTVDNTLKHPEYDDETSSSSAGEATPTSSNGSVRLSNRSWDAYMGFSEDDS